MSGENLFLDASHGQHFPPQGDLAGHGQAAVHRQPEDGRGDGSGDGDAGGRPVLGDRPLGHVHVDVDLLLEIAVQPQAPSQE